MRYKFSIYQRVEDKWHWELSLDATEEQPGPENVGEVGPIFKHPCTFHSKGEAAENARYWLGNLTGEFLEHLADTLEEVKGFAEADPVCAENPCVTFGRTDDA
jgi:hypothetical protein